jgi:hypothetical protein
MLSKQYTCGANSTVQQGAEHTMKLLSKKGNWCKIVQLRENRHVVDQTVVWRANITDAE